jgi:hypothetical protein
MGGPPQSSESFLVFNPPPLPPRNLTPMTVSGSRAVHEVLPILCEMIAGLVDVIDISRFILLCRSDTDKQRLSLNR